MIFRRLLLGLLTVAASLTSDAAAGLITSVTSSDLTCATVLVSQLPTLGNGRVLNMAVTLLQRNVPV